MAIPVPTALARFLRIVRFPVRYPGAAVEIDLAGVSAVQVRRERRGGRLVSYGLARISNGATPDEAGLGADSVSVEADLEIDARLPQESGDSGAAEEFGDAAGEEPGDSSRDEFVGPARREPVGPARGELVDSARGELVDPAPKDARAPEAHLSALRASTATDSTREVDAGVQEAIATAVRMAGLGSGRASLVVPDSAARVWILQLPELPRGNQAMLDLIRWKVKRGLPFRVEEGVISWQVLARPSGGQPASVLAGLIPRGYIRRHEAALARVGLRVGLVDVASLNLANLALRALAADGGAPAGDFGLLNATPGYFTLMLFRQHGLVFYRCKAHPVGEADAAERERTLRRELAASFSYYTERLRGGSLALTVVRSADPGMADLPALVESLGFGPVRSIDASRAARLPEGMSARIATQLQPALGAALGRHA